MVFEQNVGDKTFKVFHSKPREPHGDFILLPVGYSYNRDLLKAKRGDIIEFTEGVKYRIIKTGTINTKSQAAEALCYIRYGISLLRAIQIWKQRANVLGYGRNAIDEDECIILTYGEEVAKPRRKNRSR